MNISKEPTNKEKHVTKHINWSNASEEDRVAYARNTEKLISEIKLDHGLLLCDNVNCQDPAHQCAINILYNDIIDALQTAGTFLLETKNLRFKQIPGWNDFCAELHREARSAFLLWRTNGKPRAGPIFALMKSTRANFKLALRQSRSDTKTKDADALAQKLLSKDQKTILG